MPSSRVIERDRALGGCTLPIASWPAIPTPIDPGLDVHITPVGPLDHDFTVIAGMTRVLMRLELAVMPMSGRPQPV
jgi:hypothetical protein